MNVCRALVEALNKAGAHWLLPQQMSAGVADAIALDAEDSQKALQIQVVRVETDRTFWNQLQKTHDVHLISEACDMADTLERSIIHKVKALPSPAARRGVTLALDASRLPAYSFTDVVSAFDRRHGEWAVSLGFESIWIVGPHPIPIKRLTG